MFKKHFKAVKAFFSGMEKSTLALLIAGLVAVVLAVPVSASLKADVTSEDGSGEEEMYEEDSSEDNEDDWQNEEDKSDSNEKDWEDDNWQDKENNEGGSGSGGGEEGNWHDSADDGQNNNNSGDNGGNFGDGGQSKEQQKKNWERDTQRLSKDYRWLQREIQKNGTPEDEDQYNEILNRVQSCETFDWDCTQDIRWEMDDFNFEVQDRMEATRCEKGGERVAKEGEHRVAQMRKESLMVERDFGKEAAAEFERILDDYTKHSEEFINLTKSCKYDEAEDYRWEYLEPTQDLVREFWDKWGQQNAREFRADQCPGAELDEEITKLREEKIPSMPAEQQEMAGDLLDRAEFLIRACREAAEQDDFDNVSKTLKGLEKIGRLAEQLGLVKPEDKGGEREIRGYKDIRREDLEGKGFENQDRLEKIFEDMDAEEDYEVINRVYGADKESLNRIVEDDEEFARGKLRFLKNINADGSDLINEFLGQQAQIKTLLDEIANLKAAMGELQNEIARYNFVGEGAELMTKNLQNQDLSEEELRRTFEEAKEKSRQAKLTRGMISFIDVDDDTYYFDAVKNLSDEEIIKGKANGDFDPGAAASLAEALKIVLETTEQGYSEGETGEDAYDSHWARGYFKKALELGVPIFDRNVNRSITRGELAEMIVKALGLRYENLDTAKFNDVAKTHPYYAAIQTLNAKGVFNGSNGNARPDDSVIRADIATFMHNVRENL